MKPQIFIDGQEGTTGLMIRERLEVRNDIDILLIDDEKRKDPVEKKKLINEADLVFLCLPDRAAIESAGLLTKGKTKMIDASTAHRTHPDWTYGFPELAPDCREKISRARLVSNPGCHATGFIAAVAPLISRGVLSPRERICCQSLSGYSGAGKKLIAKYEDPKTDPDFLAGPHHYALGLTHKHLPEMTERTGLQAVPLFTPMVGPFYKGMVVTVPLFVRQLNNVSHAGDVRELLARHYEREPFVNVLPLNAEEDFIDGVFFHPQGCNDTNRLDIFVYGHDDQVVILSRLDNLGKGASGAAVQNMNIMLGFDESTGLKAD